ncbi:MAG: 50S ribosomal protein L19 [Candidatus Omnitrophota bacterium]|nr:50S ribosomal protein L19 [Candidatus Omnitrophota bacterium]
MKELEKQWLKKDVPVFNVGNTVRVYVKVVEGDKVRSQAFEGTVIAKKGSGLRQTFTVRRVSYGEGVERIFHAHSPNVEKVTVTKKTKVKRAKLYYLRKNR